MATIALRLGRDVGGMALDQAAVAQIIGLAEDGSRLPTRDRRDVVIAAGWQAEPTKVPVEPGWYLIEARTPNGQVMPQQVEVAEGANVPVDLEGQQSPREWLGWSHLMGNVRESATGGLIGGAGGGSAPMPPPPPPPPELLWLAEPAPALVDPHLGAEAWPLLAAAHEAADPMSLVGRPVDQPMPPLRSEPAGDLYRLGSQGPLGWSDHDVPAEPLTRRTWVAARLGEQLDLACLPVPWPTWGPGPSPVDVIVSQPDTPDGAMIAMSPMDPTFGPLMGFLGRSDYRCARQLVDSARERLFDKMYNPLAAAAGGYVLLATETTGDSDWHPWIANLANWFPALPDGAILHGRLLLRHRRGPDDVAHAAARFAEAAGRGLPYFTLGLQWLVEGLVALSAQDPVSAKLLEQVKPVAWLADPEQAFTTLRVR